MESVQTNRVPRTHYTSVIAGLAGVATLVSAVLFTPKMLGDFVRGPSEQERQAAIAEVYHSADSEIKISSLTFEDGSTRDYFGVDLDGDGRNDIVRESHQVGRGMYSNTYHRLNR